MASPRAEFADNAYVCLDNLEVCRSLTYRTRTSSQGVFTAFAEAARKWPERARKPHTRPGQIIISEDTYQYCQAFCADPQYGLGVASLGDIQVKGREQPVSVYHVWRQPQAVASS